jgi:hypothetical protein
MDALLGRRGDQRAWYGRGHLYPRLGGAERRHIGQHHGRDGESGKDDDDNPGEALLHSGIVPAQARQIKDRPSALPPSILRSFEG